MRLLLCLLMACAAEPAVVPEGFVERHASVFEVFDIGHAPDALHAHLSTLYAGEALTEAYLGHVRTLAAMEAGDIGVEILAVDHGKVAAERRADGLVVTASWTVRSAVRHQAHTHVRIGRYRASFQTDEGGRITAEWPADMERVRSGLKPGDLFGDGGDATDRGFVDPLELLEAGALEAE